MKEEELEEVEVKMGEAGRSVGEEMEDEREEERGEEEGKGEVEEMERKEGDSGA